MKAAELREVDKRFGRVRALAAVSGDFETGQLVHVSGANGAGKSTLLRVMAGLVRPTRGTVRVLGHDLFRSSDADVRGRVGYLGAEPGLYGELTLRENLAFCARVHGMDVERVGTVLDALGLRDMQDRRARELSFGFGRRAGFARLLVSEPELWLLDEPWNGLDRKAAARLAELLRERRSRGETALVAAHDVGEFADLFDARIELRDGRLSGGVSDSVS